MKNLLYLIPIVIIMFACNSGNKPKLVYDASENPKESKNDSSLMQVVDLPFHIDSTQYLIHAVGTYTLQTSRSAKFFSSESGSWGSFSVLSDYGDRVSGNLHNLKFQHLDSQNLRSLTKSEIRISQFNFLRGIYNKTKKSYIIYRVIDKDTNQDQELNNHDIESLYLSFQDGTGFIKLTPKNHELIDWKELPVAKRVYFRTLEDTNKNGEFDKEDQIHYHYLQFDNLGYRIDSYQPL
ncbi:hypothetical protein ACJD0Z_18060 [Flavobacteriaceae bacterium M23B6Z8]